MNLAFHKLDTAIGETVGIEKCPCTYPAKCWHWDRCRTNAVDCKNFRSWATKGGVYRWPRNPDKYFDGSKYTWHL